MTDEQDAASVGVMKDNERMKLRHGLLLGAAFTVGIGVVPAVNLLQRDFGVAFPTAYAQDSSQSGSASGHNGRAETYRLLTLFGDVFERVRADYVEPVTDRELIDNALNGMLTGLDPHSDYMTQKQFQDMQVQTTGEFGGLGLQVTETDGFVRVISAIDDTPASRAGLKTNDLIISIDNKSLDGVSLNQAVDKMRGVAGSKITLTLKEPGNDKPVNVTLTREVIHLQVVKSALYGKIGYIRLTQFNEETQPGLIRAFHALSAKAGGHLDGMILDLRNNPGGLLDQAVDVCEDFIPSGEVVSTRGRHAEDDQQWDAHGTDILDGAPLVVLINDGSASASEIVAGALKDHGRAALLGTRSFGKGSVQTVIPIPGNGAIRLTTARYYTPSGRSIQGLGIVPNVEVHESQKPQPQFGPDHESDLNHTIANQGGTAGPEQRIHLPTMASLIPHLPPATWPSFAPDKPATDFQLQQGLALVRAMSGEQHAAR